MEKIVLELKDKEKYIGQYVKFTTTVDCGLIYAKILDVKDECLISNLCWYDENYYEISFLTKDKNVSKEHRKTGVEGALLTILHKSRIIYSEVCFRFRTYLGKFVIFPEKDKL